MLSQVKVIIPKMNQFLLILNFWESKQLEYWLTDNYPDVRIRSLYDKWSQPDEEDWYAIEGHIEKELEYLLRLEYGNKIKGRSGSIKLEV